jgi:cytochrome c oxidase subunit II
LDSRHEYDHLFGIYVPIAVGVFVLFTAAILFAAWRYRERPGREATGKSESNRLEMTYAAVLILVVAFLVVLTFTTEEKTDATPDHPGLRVNVTAAKWRWRFDYPAQGVSVAGDNARTAVLVVPAGTPVAFRGRSLDVQHAFFVPERRFKHDLFPGQDTTWDLEWPKPGFYAGECAEYCGLRHSNMRFAVNAIPADQFATWVSHRRAAEAGP